MAVYIDDMYLISLGQFGNMKMSHLVADTTDELIKMIDRTINGASFLIGISIAPSNILIFVYLKEFLQ